MITLTIQNLKTGKVKTEMFKSDKAEEKLDYLRESKTKFKLIGASFDTESEKKLVAPYLGIKKPKEEEE